MFATDLNTQDDCSGWTFSHYSCVQPKTLKSIDDRGRNEGAENQHSTFIEIEPKSCAVVQQKIDCKTTGTVLYKGKDVPAQWVGDYKGTADSGNLVRVIGLKAVELPKYFLIVEPLLR